MMLIDNFSAVLRARTVALLKTIDTLAGQYVDSSRMIPVAKDDTPRIIVYLPNREYTWKGDAAPQYDTTGKLNVVGVVTGAPASAVEANADTLCEQIVSLMYYQGFLAPPVERVTGIGVDVDMEPLAGDRFTARIMVEFDVKWTEVFEPILAPLQGEAPPGAYGAPFEEITVKIADADGDVRTGATISLSTI
jgi:hypothetical protein